MTRPLLPLAPLAPAVAIIALAAASAAAEGLAAARNVLKDVQVGEEGPLLRVAVLCREACRVSARAGGVFFIPDINEDIDVDLTKKSALIDGLSLKPATGGSTLALRAEAPFSRASIKPCQLSAGAATCIDFEFAPRAETAALSPPAEERPAPAAEEAAPRRAGGPGLREAPEEALLAFARFAPPERFDPPPVPSSAPPPAFVSASPSRRPIIREAAARALVPRDIDIAALAGEILGKELGPAQCEGAEARLRVDAWALAAMVDVGFCKARAGDVEAADEVFRRLLDYTPDNYEALVGRALIAAKAGEKGLARKYFQDALTALPPIEESDRIVEAMKRL
ncbi:MAG: tetratricopeptide repeat protein [Amphiplicatus sp.]